MTIDGHYKTKKLEDTHPVLGMLGLTPNINSEKAYNMANEAYKK